MPTTSHTQQRRLIVIAGGHSHALPADRVLEILRRTQETRVPHAPPALAGVFNLRGAVLPMISLARLLNMEAEAEQIVVVLDHGGPIGLLVDAAPRLGTDTEVDEARPFDPTLLDAQFERSVRVVAASDTPLTSSDQAPKADSKRALISFTISAQSFALPLGAVMEIFRLPREIARVARAEQAVLGVVNLRDRSLPVISLAKLLGFPDAEAERLGRPVLVVSHEGSRLGLVADAMQSVMRLDETSIDRVPAILQRGHGEADLDAIGRTSSRSLVSILSVPKLFAEPVVREAIAGEISEDSVMALDQAAAHQREKYLLFELGDERYGLSVAAVDEVLRLPDTVTRLPNGPQFVTGIINLRGRPVPLIDQRQRFDVPSAGVTARPRVIVVTVGRLQAGFVVDGASEIIAVAGSDLAAAPHFSAGHSAVFKHVAKVDAADSKLILIVDPKELLSSVELDAIATFTELPIPAGVR